MKAPSLKNKMLRPGLLTTLLIVFLSISGFGQTLTTDLPDYSPGDIVTINGTGFGPGETVAVRVTHNPTCCDDDTAPDHQPWNVTADANGNFQTTWTVPIDGDELGAPLIATATGQTTNAFASVAFTDSPRVTGVSVGPQTGNLCVGTAGSVTYLVTVTGNNTPAPAKTVALCVNLGLPAGASASFSPATITIPSSAPGLSILFFSEGAFMLV